MEEIYPPKLTDFAYVTDGACTEGQILNMEIILMEVSSVKNHHVYFCKYVSTVGTRMVVAPCHSKCVVGDLPAAGQCVIDERTIREFHSPTVFRKRFC
jgi:hypothetical protein